MQKRAAEKKEAESAKPAIVQVDDLLTFRQFSKKTADDAIDVSLLGSTTSTCAHISLIVRRRCRSCNWRCWSSGRFHVQSESHHTIDWFVIHMGVTFHLTTYAPIFRLLWPYLCGSPSQNARLRHPSRYATHTFSHFILTPYISYLLKTIPDVLLVNQTSNTLQNLCLDFATLGDLKIVERPSVYTIAPHGFQSIKATIKVSSTETGVIFGSILWEGPNLSEQCVILNDIHIDIMDYIKPAYCNEAQVGLINSFFLTRLRVVCIFGWLWILFFFFLGGDVEFSSVVCGPSLSGKTVSTSRHLSRRYFFFRV